MKVEQEFDNILEYMESSLDGIFIIDTKKFMFIYANNTFIETIGIRSDELYKLSFLEIIHLVDRNKFLKYITKLKKIHIRQKYFIIKLLKKLKESIEVELVGTLCKQNNNNTFLLGIIREISKTKRLERVFSEPEIDFKDISESIKDAICIIKFNGKFRYVSPRLPDLLGGMQISSDFFDLIHPEDIDYIRNLLNNSIKDDNVIYLKSMEFRALHKDFQYIWLEATTRKYFEETTKLSGFIVVLRDINERKKLEKKLEKYHLELEEKNKKLMELDKLKSDFLSNASHELRTPLVSIKGFTELLLKGKSGDLNPQQLQDLKIIQRNTERIIHLVDDLLDVSKLESNRLIMNKCECNLTKIITESINELQYHINTRKHNIILNLPKDEIVILADNDKIHQVIINLLDNAIKYTPVKGEIQIFLDENPNAVHFYIKDNGIGMTEDEINKIFKRFGKIYMPDRIDIVNPSGTGLGLFICKGIIEKHNGKIWAYSKGRNKGSEFHFIIPKN
ncbi:MAG: PAS domain-containing sensor histidine kinase [Candidatus Helarchaeota archaeon]